MKVLVTGGYFDTSGECFIDEVDLHGGDVRRLFRHVPSERDRIAQKGFTGACWLDGDTLLVCSFNAVHRIDVRTWRETGRLTQPDFNDLHHVAIDAATRHVLVCNTGLDAVEIFDRAGCFLGRHATSPAWFERERLDGQAVDRSHFPELLAVGWGGSHPETHIPRRRPSGGYYGSGPGPAFNTAVVRDYLHPNHVAAVDGLLAVTLLGAREVRCLRTMQCLAVTDGHPHDGQVEGGHFWTSTTRGIVTAWDRTGGTPWTPCETYDAFQSGITGWCRGLLVRPEHVIVGLTEIRSQPQYAWCDRPFQETTTAIVMLARGTGRALHQTVLGRRTGRHAKIFSVLPASP
jgi:hypothetical protein